MFSRICGAQKNHTGCTVRNACGATPLRMDRMIRFVAGPDNAVVPDLKAQLPGRGCWVLAERTHVRRAMDKNLFARALKTKVTVPDGLDETIDALIVGSLTGMIALARKAGQIVAGSSKVDAAIRGGKAIAVLHATDAAADGIRKIDQAFARLENGTYGICEACEEEISIERLKVRPVTTLCIECKREEEKSENI